MGESEALDLADVRLLPVSTLQFWKRNYRRGDVDKIAASIAAFGFNGALRVWQERTVMAGNHALMALRKLMEEGAALPRHVLEDPSGDWLVPCIDVSHLDEAEAAAFALADNGIQEQGRTDSAALGALLAELGRDARGLVGATGYDPELVAHLIASKGRGTPSASSGPRPPEFGPEDDGAQPRLDKRNHVCPHCGREFEA